MSNLHYSTMKRRLEYIRLTNEQIIREKAKLPHSEKLIRASKLFLISNLHIVKEPVKVEG